MLPRCRPLCQASKTSYCVASLEMFCLIRQLHRHASDNAWSPSACLSVCQGFILCIPCLRARAQEVRWLITRLNTVLPLKQSERLYFGAQLVIVWLHLQEAPRHLAPTMCVVVGGTQTKLHTHRYTIAFT